MRSTQLPWMSLAIPNSWKIVFTIISCTIGTYWLSEPQSLVNSLMIEAKWLLRIYGNIYKTQTIKTNVKNVSLTSRIVGSRWIIIPSTFYNQEWWKYRIMRARGRPGVFVFYKERRNAEMPSDCVEYNCHVRDQAYVQRTLFGYAISTRFIIDIPIESRRAMFTNLHINISKQSSNYEAQSLFEIIQIALNSVPLVFLIINQLSINLHMNFSEPKKIKMQCKRHFFPNLFNFSLK